MKFDYTIIRSDRKTVGLQIKNDGQVIVRIPRCMAKAEAERIIAQKEEWIIRHLQKQKERKAEADTLSKLTLEEIRVLADKAVQWIPQRVAYYAPLVGVDYGRITIRNQKTRWGSCSSKGNLNFNCLLMLTPPEVIDSVVVHELCHRKQMNHSKKFYEEVYRVYPDYDQWDQWLKKHGSAIMARMLPG